MSESSWKVVAMNDSHPFWGQSAWCLGVFFLCRCKVLTLCSAHHPCTPLNIVTPCAQAPPLGTGIMSSIKSWKKRFFILREVRLRHCTRM
jgi:hypothetical protein